MVVLMENTSKEQHEGENGSSKASQLYIWNDLRNSRLSTQRSLQDLLLLGDLSQLSEEERLMLYDYKKSMEVMITQQKNIVSKLEGRLEQLNNEIFDE